MCVCIVLNTMGIVYMFVLKLLSVFQLHLLMALVATSMCLQLHQDNFTIMIAELAWLGLTGMVLIAIYARRHNYELFYYTHHFAIIFVISSVIHAWSFW